MTSLLCDDARGDDAPYSVAFSHADDEMIQAGAAALGAALRSARRVAAPTQL
jgi:hypothetical protein